jgi:ABC-type transport system involved in multi-copper enzyme maturation permease subunit
MKQNKSFTMKLHGKQKFHGEGKHNTERGYAMKKTTWSQIWPIARNIWLESVRDRLLIILTTSGLLLFIFSAVLGRMAVGGEQRVIQDMGFWVLGVWGILAVIYLGSNIVRQEIQRHTVYLVLSRPVSRSVFLCGKFFGMMIVLFSIFSVLSLFWIGLLYVKSIPFTGQHLWALVFIFGEWVLLASISLFFATFTSPILHNFFIVGIAFLGHWSNDLKLFAENSKDLWIKTLLQVIYHILPNLEALNFRNDALYGNVLQIKMILTGGTVLFFWIITALIAANLIFLKRKIL